MFKQIRHASQKVCCDIKVHFICSVKFSPVGTGSHMYTLKVTTGVDSVVSYMKLTRLKSFEELGNDWKIYHKIGFKLCL